MRGRPTKEIEEIEILDLENRRFDSLKYTISWNMYEPEAGVSVPEFSRLRSYRSAWAIPTPGLSP